MYRHEDFTGIPRRKRCAALELKLPVWSPFERTGYHCVWSGSAAMVWFWDEDKVAVDGEALDARRVETAADRTARVRVLPETVFFTKKTGRGAPAGLQGRLRAAALAGGCARGTPSGFRIVRTRAS